MTNSWGRKRISFGTKLSLKINHIERSLWLNFGVNPTCILIFWFFFCFHTLSVILVRFTCLVWVGKHMVVILIFLSSFWCIICKKISLETWWKPLMSTRKKYIYLYHLKFCSKYSLRGNGRWPLVGSQSF